MCFSIPIGFLDIQISNLSLYRQNKLIFTGNFNKNIHKVRTIWNFFYLTFWKPDSGICQCMFRDEVAPNISRDVIFLSCQIWHFRLKTGKKHFLFEISKEVIKKKCLSHIFTSMSIFKAIIRFLFFTNYFALKYLYL